MEIDRDNPTKRALQPILEHAEEQEPIQKKGKGAGKNNQLKSPGNRRMWGSKKWSKEVEKSASTPVKPSGTKTPDKQRIVEKTAETQTEPSELKSEVSVEERLKSAENDINFILKDANKMWKNQTWYNHQLIAMQRREAAQQYIFTGWSEVPDGCTADDRDRVISWAMMQANVAQFAMDISHQFHMDKLSPISIVTFRNSWQRQRMAIYMASITKTNGGISYWTADGEVSNKVKIKGRIQICTYDRVMGLPLKAALEIIGAHNLGKERVEKNWKTGELKTSGLIILKVKTDIEMGTCKVFIHKDLFEVILHGWEAAWDKVTTAPPPPKPIAKGHGKSEPEERRVRVPYEIKLVKFNEYPEDVKDDDSEKGLAE